MDTPDLFLELPASSDAAVGHSLLETSASVSGSIAQALMQTIAETIAQVKSGATVDIDAYANLARELGASIDRVHSVVSIDAITPSDEELLVSSVELLYNYFENTVVASAIPLWALDVFQIRGAASHPTCVQSTHSMMYSMAAAGKLVRRPELCGASGFAPRDRWRMRAHDDMIQLGCLSSFSDTVG
ncbi:hypothetical protein HWV62_28290 [Athelia sp. TMB]|nr:hypothetical protein HWV62_34479 [Athelia sp. TMB]KAF7969122.1 hypothetical protein HWV62_28290 [Athelia sp. TMB]